MEKLILEALSELDAETEISSDVSEETSEDLTQSESELFHSTMISDLLTKELDIYNIIKCYLSDPESQITEGAKVVLESVLEDISLSVGKLQQCLKDVVDDRSEELISQGEEEIESQNIEEEE